MIFHLRDRWDTPKGEVNVLSSKHSEELNGEDTLIIEAFAELNKGERVLWRDHLGKWHEHVVETVEKTHTEGKPVSKAKCVNSIVELWNDYIDDRRVGVSSPASASAMLTAALEPTRWRVGQGMTSATGTVTFYHTSAREAIQEIQEIVGGELVTTITVSNYGITSRSVAIVDQCGNQQSPKRFAWSKDVNTITRKVESDDCISQLYVYGKGLETDAGGYGRRVSIDSVNSGRKYLESTAAKNRWGRPDGNGGKAHSTGVVVFDQVDDPAALKSLGQAEFAKRQTPKLSYTIKVIDLASMGFTYEGVGLGDSVAIIDKGFEPALRANGRVTRIERDLLEKTATVTIGNVTEDVASIVRRQSRELSSLKKRSSSWDLIAASDQNYLEQLRGAINTMFEDNSNYQYESFTLGNLWSNVPCDQDTFSPIQPLPSGVTNPWAMNISSAGFRIASELNANGTWKWTTFGTGEGFTANAITAGVLQSAAYRNTGTGDHWILGSNGYLETYDSKFHNVQADGSMTTGVDPSSKIVLANGKINGYQNGTNYGHIDCSAVSEDVDTHAKHRGFELYSRELLRITTPIVSVNPTNNVMNTSYDTGTMNWSTRVITDLSIDSEGKVTSFSYADVNWVFKNGFFISV